MRRGVESKHQANISNRGIAKFIGKVAAYKKRGFCLFVKAMEQKSDAYVTKEELYSLRKAVKGRWSKGYYLIDLAKVERNT